MSDGSVVITLTLADVATVGWLLGWADSWCIENDAALRGEESRATGEARVTYAQIRAGWVERKAEIARLAMRLRNAEGMNG